MGESRGPYLSNWCSCHHQRRAIGEDLLSVVVITARRTEVMDFGNLPKRLKLGKATSPSGRSRSLRTPTPTEPTEKNGGGDLLAEERCTQRFPLLRIGEERLGICGIFYHFINSVHLIEPNKVKAHPCVLHISIRECRYLASYFIRPGLGPFWSTRFIKHRNRKKKKIPEWCDMSPSILVQD